ncbi:MAG TPA: hypothetical protein VMQ65_04180 [Candidatus Limnocylindria bacterium]|nr:hypothetical protein [Candidatus Limnocylindria bacterium]
MHTFVVRVFVAENLEGFDGVVEEPLTGDRRTFHDAATLVAWLLGATERHASRSRLGEPFEPARRMHDEGDFRS